VCVRAVVCRIQLDVLAEPVHSLRARLEGVDNCTAAHREDGVGADIGSHVAEHVASPQQMQNETHLLRLVEADVQIASGARQSARGKHPGALDKLKGNRA
jgi:hypothetical protein